MKIRLVRVELFNADGQTDMRADMTKLIDAFRNFAKAPTNTSIYSHVFLRTYKYQSVIAGR